MNILVIDQGTYSVKFTLFAYERRALRVVRVNEVILSEIMAQQDDLSLHEARNLTIQTFLNESQFNGKVISQLPHDLTTNRFIKLPITNRKKAELMIPFQLDEELPYSSTSLHFAAHMLKEKDGFYSVISSANLNDFNDYYHQMELKHILPNVLTSEASVVQTYAQLSPPHSTFALVDIGHQTTKIYIVQDQRLVATYVSYVGGEKVNEAIAQNYDISLNEASAYKHENSFFLTEKQYEEVNAEQLEFAKIMRHIFQPLIQDLKRLDLGFKVNKGVEIENLYLCGGSSNIKNIENFFTEHLNIRTKMLNFSGMQGLAQSQMDDKMLRSFYFSQFVGDSILHRKSLSNFRKGEYASTSSEELPIYSAGFFGVRVIALCLIFFFVFLVESLLIKLDIQRLNKKITKNLSRPIFNLRRSDIKRLRSNPKQILRRLERHHKVVSQEVSTMQSAVSLNGTKPLVDMHTLLSKNKKVDLIYFKNMDKYVEAKFSSEDETLLTEIASKLKSGISDKIDVDKIKDSKELTVTYTLD